MDTLSQHEDLDHPLSIPHQDKMFPSEEKLSSSDEKRNTDDNSLEESQPIYHNGIPIITTGRDVSYFVVDIRDYNDPALTFRSMVLGTVFAVMGAALCQVNSFSSLSTGFNLSHSDILIPSLVDIYVQASANGRFPGLLVTLDLYCRECLG